MLSSPLNLTMAKWRKETEELEQDQSATAIDRSKYVADKLQSDASSNVGRLIICEDGAGDSKSNGSGRKKESQQDTNSNMKGGKDKADDTKGDQVAPAKRRHSSPSKTKTQVQKGGDKGSQTGNENECVVKRKRQIKSPIDKNDPQLTAIDDEIDKVLVEKQLKNNLTAANVKSIIYQVITNKMVTKMMISKLRHDKVRDQERAKHGAGEPNELEDDDFLPFEPKLTRSKAKELWNTTNPSGAISDVTGTELAKCGAAKRLWPISPSKLQLLERITDQSEEEAMDREDEINFNLLMKNDLPPELDDSEDDEYIPSKFDTSHLSDDDCNSSAASVASEAGSPASGCSYLRTPTSTPPRRTRRKDIANAEETKMAETNYSIGIDDTDSNNGLFKTPELPKVKSRSRQNDHAIGLRTRSKLPLNDTPIEHLEDQFIPPDITTDMYDWNQDTESDNEDYFKFLKAYWRPSELLDNSKNMEDEEEEADPEYNVMEDEDNDQHDKEEHRDDRAVKIPKKELTELVAELFDAYNDTDVDFEQLLGVSSANFESVQPQQPLNTDNNSNTIVSILDKGNTIIAVQDGCEGAPAAEIVGTISSNSQLDASGEAPIQNQNEIQTVTASMSEQAETSTNVEVGMTAEQKEILHDQIRKHVQLLAQTFILTETFFRPSANEAKQLLNDIWCRSQFVESSSSEMFSVCNIKPAISCTNKWLMNRSKSPIKKKILEERYLNSTYTKCGFPTAVVKAIAESEAFCYPELLPRQYINHKDRQASESSSEKGTKVPRTLKNEDAILIYQLDKMDKKNATSREQADFISQSLPLTKSVYQIYHRLRNMRKTKNKMYQNYVKDGMLPAPKPDDIRWIPNEPCAPINKLRARLPHIWQRMLYRLEVVLLDPSQTSSNPTNPAGMMSLKSAMVSQWSPRRRQMPKSTTQTKKKSQTKTNVKINIYNKIENSGLPCSYFIPSKQPVRKSEVLKIPEIPKTARTQSKARAVKRKENNIIRRTFPVMSRFNPTLFSVPLLVPEVPPVEDTCHTIKIHNNNKLKSVQCKIPSYVFHQQKPDPSELVNDMENKPEESVKKSLKLEIPATAKLDTSTSKKTRSPCTTPRFVKPAKKINLRDCKPIIYDDEDEDEEPRDLSLDSKSSLQAKNEDKIDFVDLVRDEDEDEESVLPSSSSHSPRSSRSETSDTCSSDEHILPPSSGPFDLKLANPANCTGGNVASVNSVQSDNSSHQAQCNNGRAQEGPGGSHLSDGVERDALAGQNPGGDGDGDDDKDKSNNKFIKDFSSDADENSQEEVGEDEELENGEMDDKKPLNDSSHEEKKSQCYRKRKGSKCSPPYPTANKSSKRSSKYNTKSIEELLEPDESVDTKGLLSESTENSDSKHGNARERFEDIQTAFVECYIARARQRIEVDGKNPGLFNAFIQLLTESVTATTVDRVTQQKELYIQVESLLRGYPDLVREFTGILDPDVASEVGRYTDHLQERTYFKFLEVVERWAEPSPQLKARILQKCRMLRDDQNITKEKVVAVIDSLLEQNVLIIDAFKAMFPMFFCPESNARDFEEIDLDMEEKPANANASTSADVTPSEHEMTASSSTDIDAELIKLPEETNPVASSTCPCTCHENSTNLQFRNRAKHCNKCRIKFQDGKIYAISGRTMKPVDVQHTLPSIAKDIVQKKTCSTCHKPLPKTKPKSNSSPVAAKKSVPTASTSAVNICTCTALSMPETDTLSDSVVKPFCSTTMMKGSPISRTTSVSVQAHSQLQQSQSPLMEVQQQHQQQPTAVLQPSRQAVNWTMDEDRIILRRWQSGGWPTGSSELEMLLPNKSPMEINERITYLQKFVESVGKSK